MKKLKDIVLDIIYRQKNNNRSSIPTFESGILFEDVAFHKLPLLFKEEIIKIIKNMKEKQIVEKEIDLRNIFDLIKLQEVENFKHFFDFIQILKNSSIPKILTIQMGFECSYTEPIELIELSDKQYSKIFHNKPYEEMLKKKIKNQCFSNALKIMKKYINGLSNLGTLIINPNLITDKMFEYDNDDTIIGHQIRHFLIFLQRWSKTNYQIFKVYSYQKVPEYNRQNPNIQYYFLNEDEFITLSATYIERLINIFLKNKRSLKIQEINLLIQSLLIKADSLNNYNIKDPYWYDLLDENIPQIKSIIEFFRTILNDRKYKFEKKIKGKKDKFKTLMNWTYRSFNEKIEEIIKNRTRTNK